jgi:hypothetical protein
MERWVTKKKLEKMLKAGYVYVERDGKPVMRFENEANPLNNRTQYLMKKVEPKKNKPKK